MYTTQWSIFQWPFKLAVGNRPLCNRPLFWLACVRTPSTRQIWVRWKLSWAKQIKREEQLNGSHIIMFRPRNNDTRQAFRDLNGHLIATPGRKLDDSILARISIGILKNPARSCHLSIWYQWTTVLDAVQSCIRTKCAWELSHKHPGPKGVGQSHSHIVSQGTGCRSRYMSANWNDTVWGRTVLGSNIHYTCNMGKDTSKTVLLLSRKTYSRDSKG